MSSGQEIPWNLPMRFRQPQGTESTMSLALLKIFRTSNLQCYIVGTPRVLISNANSRTAGRPSIRKNTIGNFRSLDLTHNLHQLMTLKLNSRLFCRSKVSSGCSTINNPCDRISENCFELCVRIKSQVCDSNFGTPESITINEGNITIRSTT